MAATDRHADAITFLGGANTLATNSGTYTGDIDLVSGSGATLTLSQTGASATISVNITGANGAVTDASVTVATSGGYGLHPVGNEHLHGRHDHHGRNSGPEPRHHRLVRGITVGGAGTGSIAFGSGGGAETLRVENVALSNDHSLAYSITGFAVGGNEVIEVGGVGTDLVSYSAADGTLTFSNGGVTQAILHIGTGYGGDTFTAVSDGAGGARSIEPTAWTTVSFHGLAEMNS